MALTKRLWNYWLRDFGPSLAHNNFNLWEQQVPIFLQSFFVQGTNSSCELLFQKRLVCLISRQENVVVCYCWKKKKKFCGFSFLILNCKHALSPHALLLLDAVAPIVRTLALSLSSLGTPTAQSLFPYHISSMGVWHYSCLRFKDPAQNLIARRPLTSMWGLLPLNFKAVFHHFFEDKKPHFKFHSGLINHCGKLLKNGKDNWCSGIFIRNEIKWNDVV